MNLKHCTEFLDNLFSQLEKKGVDLSGKEIDHICYRTSSNKNYEATKAMAQEQGELLIESEVNGRLIATYKLNSPIVYKQWSIPLLEVPAPKAHKETSEGFEHIEVVIDEFFESLISRYPDLSFNQEAINKKINPDIKIELNGCSLKFHHQSLEKVIKWEMKNLPFIK